MTFRDIFKSGFLARTAQLSVADMAVSMLLAFAIGLFIFYIYKKSYRGVMYSANFGTSLIAVALVTTFVMLAVTSNVVLSLGMVGALSIVRFRTAIKEPSDIAFLFWAIAAGIVLAAGFIPLAIFGSVLIGAVLYGFSQRKNLERPYILVLHVESAENERAAHAFVAQHVKKLSLKSKSVAPGAIELNYEVRLREEDSSFINELALLDGVTHTVLVSYNGDYMGDPMLKSKHIDRLCLAVIGVAVLVTLAFMNGERFGLAPASAEPGYATRLFDASRVHTIDIEIDDWQAFLAAAPEEQYWSADLVIDGERIDNVGLRAMKNWLAFDMMRFMDVPTPLASYTWVTVNGEPWGLFLAIEEPEEAFARRVYGRDHGQL